MIGISIFVGWPYQSGPVGAIASSFIKRVTADGGTVESPACLRADLRFLTQNP